MNRRSSVLEQWELRDPGPALTTIAQSVPLAAGTVALASFACRRGGADRFVGASRIHTDANRPDEWAARDMMRDAALALAGGRHGGAPTQTAVIVICREGRVISTENEWFWFNAWWYSNHFADLLGGEPYVITPHGWTGLFDDRAGFEPRLG